MSPWSPSAPFPPSSPSRFAPPAPLVPCSPWRPSPPASPSMPSRVFAFFPKPSEFRRMCSLSKEGFFDKKSLAGSARIRTCSGEDHTIGASVGAPLALQRASSFLRIFSLSLVCAACIIESDSFCLSRESFTSDTFSNVSSSLLSILVSLSPRASMHSWIFSSFTPTPSISCLISSAQAQPALLAMSARTCGSICAGSFDPAGIAFWSCSIIFVNASNFSSAALARLRVLLPIRSPRFLVHSCRPWSSSISFFWSFELLIIAFKKPLLQKTTIKS